ncbi:MAG: hypothetical protein J6570_04560 [Snodgrassella sp.]|nr:hypothetical protein [Snodgrassella sp.]
MPRLNGVACIYPTTSQPERQAKSRAGIVGTRLNVIDGTLPERQSAS